MNSYPDRFTDLGGIGMSGMTGNLPMREAIEQQQMLAMRNKYTPMQHMAMPTPYESNEARYVEFISIMRISIIYNKIFKDKQTNCSTLFSCPKRL